MTNRKQFEEDPEIAARVEVLKQLTADYKRGHMLLWEVAEAALDMLRDDERLRYAVHKWRKYCHHELRIETWAIPGAGIKLLTESEQVAMLPQKRAKKAYRQHGLILRSIKNTNILNLSEHERRMERNAGEGVDRHAERTGRRHGRHDGHSRRELAQRVAQLSFREIRHPSLLDHAPPVV